jgi:hypothetical protein
MVFVGHRGLCTYCSTKVNSKISITIEMYSHALLSMQQEAMGKMDEVFKSYECCFCCQY